MCILATYAILVLIYAAMTLPYVQHSTLTIYPDFWTP